MTYHCPCGFYTDPPRREILELLKSQNLTPSDMIEHLNISQPTLSHHLDILKRADLIDGERDGQFISCSLNMSLFQMAVDYMMQFLKKRR